MIGALDVGVWRVPTPIPRPVLTAAGLYDTYFHLVVTVRSDGLDGWGYAGLASALQLDGACDFAESYVRDGLGLADLLGAERYGHDTPTRGAACALALAGWDLVGVREDLPVADLWGRRSSAPLPGYASGFFLDASDDELRAEAESYVAAGFRHVKMRTGLALANDVRRYRIIKEYFPSPGAIAVDAFHSWSTEGARAFLGAVDGDLLWSEDTVPYGEMPKLVPSKAPLASAESLETPAEIAALCRDAPLDFALPDIGRLGGPHGWLRAASFVAAAGRRVGSHIYTAHSLHLLACVDDPLPVEWFDWSDALFAAPVMPDSEGCFAAVGPGFGAARHPEVLERYGERVC